MKRVRLHLAPGGVHPVYELLTTSPSVERASSVHWNVTEDGTLTMLHRIRGDVDGIEAALEGIGQLQAYEVLRVDETDSVDASSGGVDAAPVGESATKGETAYVYLRDEGTDDSRRLFRSLSRDGVLMVGPIEYDETGASFTVVGEDRVLSRAHESIPDRFDVTIDGIGEPESAIDPTSELSDRQREAARVGVELGYFDVPREASHEDVARVLECAPSTAAEHLQKAQSRLVRSAFEDDTLSERESR
ncbi:helix-turn-helix domain-containing protein [Halobacteria archaeon AArc-m2/3/4]|uniref:Helix-turn-helix domain-containing protein n=1 Tax=Natronoglomus mannanivorans TaxID=2979990 RepID=A0AAP3E3A7_9EURY|nr:helix-turn-helix domain-containing protein [Halobacteria archaeon AArc-xg1-1]MCU4974822.1 helix-turn-helix domain-containing protein [Halobacteria archaeon AArc-m2/3/4]